MGRKYTREHYESYVKPWQAKNQDRLKRYRKDADLYKKYGIRLDDYNKLLVEQSALCAVCNQPETQVHPKSGLPYQLSVDHCHKTGKVRELLCNNCNRVLGAVNDNVELLGKLQEYLKKHGA